MKTVSVNAVRALVVGAGLALSVAAQGATTMKLQVSRALAEDWHDTIDAKPGDSIDIRVTVSYTGAGAPLGFSSTIFQPTVSNWRIGSGGDVLSPFLATGTQTTTPIGAVVDAPGQYGRVMPNAAVIMTAPLIGHLHAASPTTGNVSYLRIARQTTTNWIGGPGNTTGVAGVNMKQLNALSAGRNLPTPQPAFSGQLTDVVLFKFNVVLSADTSVRTLTVDAPIAGVLVDTNTGLPYVGWYANPNEETPSLRDVPTIERGFINVPGPCGVAVLGLAGLVGARRRRG